MNLTTTYLGLKLRTPLVAAASPLSEEIDNIKRMEDAGASAVVLHSLFEEQLRLDRAELAHHLEQGTESLPKRLPISPSRRNSISAPRNISTTLPGPKRRRAFRLLRA